LFPLEGLQWSMSAAAETVPKRTGLFPMANS
jgi:hypothetical protein